MIDVKKVAKLANLPLTEEEEAKYSEQLAKILDYIDQLNAVDTENIEPTYNVSGLNNIMAEDEVIESLPQELATKNGSNVKDGFFVTKGVFEE
jgi:aspartyl-tRNA(Asn)/glutamyl-tRNA(Gln) amidotransferase subunit C